MSRILSSPWTGRLSRWMGYPTFYFLAMLVFVRCTFPYDRLGERAITTLNAAEAKKTGRRVEVDSVRGNWIFGLGFRGVRVVSPGAKGEDGKAGPERVVQWDYARASVAPLRLLFGTLRVAFAGGAGDGTVDGVFWSSKTERRVGVELEQFALQDIPLLADTIGVPLLGTATGKADLVFAEQRLSLAEGTIELVMEDVTLGDGKAKIRNFVALPPVRAGQLTLVAEVTEGRVKLTKLEAKGPDLEFSVRGQIRLRDAFDKSLADLTLEYKFAEQYKTKNEMTKGLFGDKASKITGLLDLDPKIQRAKTADGGYAWRVSGSMGHLSFQAAPSGAAGAASRSRRAPGSKGDDSEDEE